jgi:hypothetical protein
MAKIVEAHILDVGQFKRRISMRIKMYKGAWKTTGLREYIFAACAVV